MKNYEKLFLFKDIKVDVDFEIVLKRLGCTKSTQLKTQNKNEFYEIFLESFDYIKIDAVAKILKIEELNSQKLILENNLIFESSYLHKWLEGCQDVIFMGSTAGEQIVKIIEELSLNKDLTKALIFNTVAGEAADNGLNYLMTFFKTKFIREMRKVTDNRWSAGFADFSLKYQKDFAEILNMKDLGVEVLPSYMLKPEKSVTAFCGIF